MCELCKKIREFDKGVKKDRKGEYICDWGVRIGYSVHEAETGESIPTHHDLILESELKYCPQCGEKLDGLASFEYDKKLDDLEGTWTSTY